MRVSLVLLVASNAAALSLRRRDVLGGAAALAVPLPAAAASSKEIAVIGAGGHTGALTVAACLRRGVAVRALSRTGACPPGVDAAAPGLKIATCDVRDPESLLAGVKGATGVVYAASGSKKGGNPHLVDNLGVVDAARACARAKVPRYVVISSTAVTRPKSLGFAFTNVYGNIMAEKAFGEEGVRAALAGSGSAFTIVRPGGLEEPKLNVVQGPSALEISQGDALAGIVSRADLAEVAEAALLGSSATLRDASFELYYADGTQPCEGKFKKLLADPSFARLRGDSYAALFRDVKSDGAYAVPA